MFLRIVIILFLFCTNVNAKHLYPEKDYQNTWCNKWQGQSEVKLIDNTRVDCITKTYAVEFDFAPKWAEAVGQSLHYARLTGKKPAIVLIIENDSDFKYYNKIKPLCEQYGITLWYMNPPKIQTQHIHFDISEIIELIFKLIKELIKLFSNF